MSLAFDDDDEDDDVDGIPTAPVVAAAAAVAAVACDCVRATVTDDLYVARNRASATSVQSNTRLER